MILGVLIRARAAAPPAGSQRDLSRHAARSTPRARIEVASSEIRFFKQPTHARASQGTSRATELA